MKLKSKKSALVLSFVSVMLCVAMLVGSTFAWFTDTASANVNRIQSGNLDVKLEMQTADGEWENAEGKTLNFKTADDRTDNILWEPGCTYELPALRVVNNGNLALKYKIQITGIDGDSKLNDAIEWTISDGTTTALGADHPLAAGETSGALTIKGHMKEDAGNEYQNLTIDGIGITVYATQLGGTLDGVAGEYDSKNNTYDENATYPLEILSKIDNAEMKKDTAGENYVYTNSDETVTVTVPAAAVETGKTPTVTITPNKDVQDDTATAIAAEGKDAVAYDISVSNVPDSNTEDITVKLFVGKGLQNVEVYHKGAKMTSGAVYNPATGVLTITTASFSPFDITFDTPVAAVNSTAYYTLADAVAAAKDGDTLTLMKDVTLVGTVVVDEKLTLDLNGKTVSNTEDIWNESTGNWSHVSVRKGGDLTITGNGTLQTKANDCYAVDVQDGSTLTIENGTFVGNIHAVYVLEGTAYIKGGTYSVQQKYSEAKPDEFVLNCYDANREAGTAKIIVTGGTFANFNPADCWAEGKNTNFLAEGYISVQDGDSWTVEKLGEGKVAVTPATIQDYLDGKYGSISGKTLVLAAGEYDTLNIGRVTADTKGDITLTCNHTEGEHYSFTTAEEYKAHVAENVFHYTSTYTRKMNNVTLVANGDVTVKGILIESGHLHQLANPFREGYTGYYMNHTMSGFTFEGIKFVGNVDINTSSEDTVIDGFTFENCTFTTNGTSSDKKQAIRYYNENNNGQVKNLVVKNCTFTDCYQGVYTGKVHGISVTGCTFDTTGHNAIAVQGENVNHGAVVITGNSFNNIGDRIIRFNTVGSDTQITIQNNTATNSGDSAGEVIKATSLADGITYTISGNSWGDGKVVNEELKDR